MSLAPILFRDVWDDQLEDPINPYFGDYEIDPDDLVAALTAAFAAAEPIRKIRRNPSAAKKRWRKLRQKSAPAIRAPAEDRFQINVDVQHFTPQELSVTVADKCITVEGRHEEKEDDHGFVTRHFVRRRTLPDEYDDKKLESSLSSDGILTVTAPKKASTEEPEPMRQIQIVQTGELMKKD